MNTPLHTLTRPYVLRLTHPADDPTYVEGHDAVLHIKTSPGALVPPGQRPSGRVLCFQVLSDPARRLVYDVYGREGLAAGLQVGAKLAGREELKAEWERFQRQRVCRAEASQDLAAVLYICSCLCSIPERP